VAWQAIDSSCRIGQHHTEMLDYILTEERDADSIRRWYLCMKHWRYDSGYCTTASPVLIP
jgi:hypothetical protein